MSARVSTTAHFHLCADSDIRQSYVVMAANSNKVTFPHVYKQAVARINVEKLLEAVEMSSADEVGIRICLLAFKYTAEVVTNLGRGYEVSISRVNTSGSEGFKKTDEIAKDSPFLTWHYWYHMASQLVDGIFCLEVTNNHVDTKQHPKSSKRLICYESDFSGNHASKALQVVRKMQQAVDIQRAKHEAGGPDGWARTAITIRANGENGTLDPDNPNSPESICRWLYDFQKSHIEVAVRVVFHQLGLHRIANDDDRNDYHFFIGCFGLTQPDNLKALITFPDDNDYYGGFTTDNMLGGSWPVTGKCHAEEDEAEYVLSWVKFAKEQTTEREKFKFPPTAPALQQQVVDSLHNEIELNTVQVNNSSKKWMNRPTHSSFGTTLPYPICVEIQDMFYADDIVRQIWTIFHPTWEAKISLWRFAGNNNEIQCLGIQNTKSDPDDNKQRGLWCVHDIRTQLQKCTGDVWEEIKRAKDEKGAPDNFWKDWYSNKYRTYYLAIVQNILTQTERALLRALGYNETPRLLQNQYTNPRGILEKTVGIPRLRWNTSRFGKTSSIDLSKWRHALRKLPDAFRRRDKFPFSNFFRETGSLRDRCFASMNQRLPQLDHSVQEYIDPLNIPNATIFLRALRVPNILALRELARQSFAGPMSENYEKMLATMPVGTQSELNFMFARLRNELDVAIDKAFVEKRELIDYDIGQAIDDLGRICEFEIPHILNRYFELNVSETEARYPEVSAFVDLVVI